MKNDKKTWARSDAISVIIRRHLGIAIKKWAFRCEVNAIINKRYVLTNGSTLGRYARIAATNMKVRNVNETHSDYYLFEKDEDV